MIFIAVGGGLVTLGVWLGLAGSSLDFALERMVTVMVIACPHALGLAVPLVAAVSTALAAKNGLLIRNRKAFEQARRIQAIIFDKTGTLTHGRFGVTDVLVLDDALSEKEIRRCRHRHRHRHRCGRRRRRYHPGAFQPAGCAGYHRPGTRYLPQNGAEPGLGDRIYNLFAIPLAAGVLYQSGILLSPAVEALFMSLSTVIVALNARLLKMKR